MKIVWDSIRGMFGWPKVEGDSDSAALTKQLQQRHDDALQFLDELEREALIDIERLERKREQEDDRWKQGT